ncbi:laccase [Heterobasidion irregulare TC 32-1]|uniref:laccase n=1 Tax=Heterobasidion irregulare (strain TC 32-1) TaxID=747525 RepID=W4K2W6_HETIT|nr:laccase [Heterobasidion irregulare TC 32-1]ETW79401.1 laccase [Heterobasidion irregulare TC 32-1]
MWVTSLLQLSLAAQALASIGPVADLLITNTQLSPDGFERDTVSAASVYPGPLITGKKGDNFRINVTDLLTDGNMLKSTSIHWHGLFQHSTNEHDGVSFVTQCPIAPSHSFLYNFTAADQAGTFWYHSHLSTQYCDGLRGPLVIYDPEDAHASLYDVDDDSTVITLSDWYHVFAPSAGLVPTPDATLINGLGRYVDGPSSPLAVVNVTAGKRYRLRLINMSCDPNYVFSIDGHNFTVIEADGISTQAVVADSVHIFASQRYSLVLEANQPVANYWIRAQPNLGTTSFDGGLNMGILRYVGAEDADPTTNQTDTVIPLVETNLHPLQSLAVPGTPERGGADILINLDVVFNFTLLQFTVNGQPFASPSVPVLLQILSGASKASDLLPAGSIYGLETGKSVEISIPGGAVGGGHPIHLHGHAFDVIRSAGSDTYNYVNPVRRDTVNIGTTGDNVTIRFQTDNPGPWFIHCHIDWHLEAGFAVVMAEGIEETNTTNIVPADWSTLCPVYDALDASDH